MSNHTDSTNIDVQTYELTYFLTTESTASVTAALALVGGELIHERSLEKVSLAYPVRKQRQAFMGVIRFSVEPAHVSKLLRELGLQGDVLRSFVASYSSEDAKKDAYPSSLGYRRGGHSSVSEPKRTDGVAVALTNEALEKKIEEISG